MVKQGKKQMGVKAEPRQPSLPLDANTAGETGDHGDGEQVQKTATVADIRQASYFILTIAAIFVINAMETGSYRTPWPVAVVVSLAGFGVLAYSFVKAKRS